MKMSLAVLAACLSVLAAPPLLAKSKPVFLENGRDYEPLRYRLRKTGWHAVGREMRGNGDCPADMDARCEVYSEAVTCSGDGLLHCKMAWRHDDGTLVYIVTTGAKELIVYSADLGE